MGVGGNRTEVQIGAFYCDVHKAQYIHKLFILMSGGKFSLFNNTFSNIIFAQTIKHKAGADFCNDCLICFHII